MSNNALHLYHLQVRRLEEQLINLRNHATTLHGCEKAAYFIDKAIADVRSHIAGQLTTIDDRTDAENDGSPAPG